MIAGLVYSDLATDAKGSWMLMPSLIACIYITTFMTTIYPLSIPYRVILILQTPHTVVDCGRQMLVLTSVYFQMQPCLPPQQCFNYFLAHVTKHYRTVFSPGFEHGASKQRRCHDLTTIFHKSFVMMY
jgi:hypothetical protein